MNHKPRFNYWLFAFTSVVFILLIVYLYFTDLQLVYFVNQPFFSHTASFFCNQIMQPGGLANYLNLFLFQFYQSTIASLLIIVSGFMVFCLVLYHLLNKWVQANATVLCISLLMIPVLIEQGNYFVMPHILVMADFGLICALLYHKLQRDDRIIDYLLFFGLSISAFYLAGYYAWALFCCTILPFQILRKRYINAVIHLLIAFLPILIWLLLAPHWVATPGYSTSGFLFSHAGWEQWLINLLPVMVAIIIFSGKMLPNGLYSAKVLRIFSLVILAVWVTVFFVIVPKPMLKKCIEIDQMAANEQWDLLLAVDDQALLNSPQIKPTVYRALYHKGVLLDQLFNYTETDDQDNLIVHSPQDASIAVPLMDIYFDMGLINEARHWANEALTATGWHPNSLIRLIESYLIMGEYNTAEKYINLLATSPVNKQLAKKYKRYLNCPDCVKRDDRLGKKVGYKPRNDFFVTYYNPYNNLVNLMRDSLPQKMVLEYTMAFELFRKNPGPIFSSVNDFKRLGYSTLPINLQEAILFYKALKGIKTTDDLLGYQFDKGVIERFNLFSGILLDQFKGDKNAARSSLGAYKNTFWYYFLYSNVQNSNSLK